MGRVLRYTRFENVQHRARACVRARDRALSEKFEFALNFLLALSTPAARKKATSLMPAWRGNPSTYLFINKTAARNDNLSQGEKKTAFLPGPQ